MTGKTYQIVRMLLAVVCLFLAAFSFVSAGTVVSRFAMLQFGPALVGLAAGTFLAGIMVALGIVVTTFLFGRYFCAILCPLGTLQDGLLRIGSKRKRSGKVPNPRMLRYVIAAVFSASLAGGWMSGFRFFEPFSRFGAIVVSLLLAPEFSVATIGGIISLLMLVLLTLWRKRGFCIALCPLGTILGLMAKYGMYRIGFAEQCVACGRCESHCPTGCIDVSKRVVDNERCIVCLGCLSQCAVGGIGYSKKPRIQAMGSTGSIDYSRRAFLGKSAAATAGVIALGYGLDGPLRRLAYAGDGGVRILPPGAGDLDRFNRLCTGCQLCVASCPTKILRPTIFGFGPVGLDYNRGRCDFECVRCLEVCPSGALQRMLLADKQWLHIGEAVVNSSRCRVATQNEACDLCAQACPKKAIFMASRPAGPPIPEVNVFHCIGCGACQAACPASPKAIVVRSVGAQT